MKKTILLLILTLLAPAFGAAQPQAGPVGQTGAAWSPYVAGALIGVLCIMTFYFSQKPLGASTAYARTTGLLVKAFAPRHVESLEYYKKKKPKIDWEVMLVVGIVIGAFVAAWTGGEFTGRWLPPMWTERFGTSIWLRLLVGGLGGGLMAFGARLAGGCTSGHGISGTLQLAVSSWIAVSCFFVGGVITAFILYRI